MLYWALFCAGARASVNTRAMALRILVWGMAGLGLVLAIEAMTGAGLYQALRTAIGDPIRQLRLTAVMPQVFAAVGVNAVWLPFEGGPELLPLMLDALAKMRNLDGSTVEATMYKILKRSRFESIRLCVALTGSD